MGIDKEFEEIMNRRIFRHRKIDDVGLICLSDGLAKLKKLKGLGFTFFGCGGLTDHGVLNLCGRLKEMTDITNITLSLFG